MLSVLWTGMALNLIDANTKKNQGPFLEGSGNLTHPHVLLSFKLDVSKVLKIILKNYQLKKENELVRVP